MQGNFTYDNFSQCRFKIDGEWVEGVVHGDWFISLKGEAYKLDNINDEDIVEHTWKELI